MALTERQQKWRIRQELTPERLELARRVIDKIRSGSEVMRALRSHPLPEGGYLGKSMLVGAYQEMVTQGEIAEEPALLERIRMKPVRTLSGVTTVTVLTKPYPCRASASSARPMCVCQRATCRTSRALCAACSTTSTLCQVALALSLASVGHPLTSQLLSWVDLVAYRRLPGMVRPRCLTP
jgi:hypothetical protein